MRLLLDFLFGLLGGTIATGVILAIIASKLKSQLEPLMKMGQMMSNPISLMGGLSMADMSGATGPAPDFGNDGLV